MPTDVMHARFSSSLSACLSHIVGNILATPALPKRKAGEAGLTWDATKGQVFRMEIHIPPDRVTRNIAMHIHLMVCTQDTIFQATKMLT